MGFFQFILPTRRQTGSGLLVSGIVLAFIVASSQTEALPTMNLGSLWFHHNNVEPWNHKDFPYNNNRNRWYTTTPKVYELEGISDDGIGDSSVEQDVLRRPLKPVVRIVPPWWQQYENWRNSVKV